MFGYSCAQFLRFVRISITGLVTQMVGITFFLPEFGLFIGVVLDVVDLWKRVFDDGRES